MVMIRRGPHKFIHSPVDPDQLFNLSHDPGERDNLADDPSCAALSADLRAELAKRWNLAELDASVRDSQRRRRLVDAALNKGKIQAWDFQPFQKASRQYVRNSMDLDDLEERARFPPVARH
jgi:choline-sulfatase